MSSEQQSLCGLTLVEGTEVDVWMEGRKEGRGVFDDDTVIYKGWSDPKRVETRHVERRSGDTVLLSLYCEGYSSCRNSQKHKNLSVLDIHPTSRNHRPPLRR